VILAYHAIFGAYGFWLPNDPRGSWSSFVRSYELYLLGGAATKTNERRSLAYDPHDRARRESAKRALKYPPVVFTGKQAVSIGRGFAAQVAKSGYIIHACAVMPDHVHLVVKRHHYDIEQVVNLMKGAATRRLLDDDMHPMWRFRDAEEHVPSCWAERSGWQVYLETEEAILRAIQYVEQNPVGAGLKRQHWKLVTPFRGGESG
jgi:REP element-mobilizing transposase RayT